MMFTGGTVFAAYLLFSSNCANLTLMTIYIIHGTLPYRYSFTNITFTIIIHPPKVLRRSIPQPSRILQQPNPHRHHPLPRKRQQRKTRRLHHLLLHHQSPRRRRTRQRGSPRKHRQTPRRHQRLVGLLPTHLFSLAGSSKV